MEIRSVADRVENILTLLDRVLNGAPAPKRTRRKTSKRRKPITVTGKVVR